MLLLTHRLGALGDLSPLPLLWGIALTPSFPPGCSRSLGPYSPSRRALSPMGRHSLRSLPRSSWPQAPEPHLALGSVSLAVPPSPPGVPAQPQPMGSHSLWLSQRREERGLEGRMGLSEGSPPAPGRTRERARSRRRVPCSEPISRALRRNLPPSQQSNTWALITGLITGMERRGRRAIKFQCLVGLLGGEMAHCGQKRLARDAGRELASAEGLSSSLRRPLFSRRHITGLEPRPRDKEPFFS